MTLIDKHRPYTQALVLLEEVLKTRNLRQTSELAHFGFRVKLANMLSAARHSDKPDDVIDAEIQTFIHKYTKPRIRRSK